MSGDIIDFSAYKNIAREACVKESKQVLGELYDLDYKAKISSLDLDPP